MAEADKQLTVAQKEAATAAKALKDAQTGQTEAMRAAAAAGDQNAAAQLKAKGANEESKTSLSGVTKAAGLMTLGMLAAGYESVKMAGNFQDATTHLVTDAGESAKNLSMVQAGILQVSTATGTSATAINNAMYHIESGGYHGAAGLTMLKIAAEGARVGGADLDTVSKTLVGAMNAYGMSASKSASFMNQLISTVSVGDMRMQDLASSLSSVTPLAAAVGIKFSQVGGAIATMTAQGMSADQATQDLAHTIRALSNPNNVAIGEMNQLGVNAQNVSKNLGSRGLAGTIQYLTQAITSHMGKSGQVIMSAFTQSTTAGQDLQIMLKNMPPAFQSLAKGYLNGQVSAKQWRTELQAQTPINQHLMTQFAGLANKANSFNSLLASGNPAAQTYTAALAKMMGGATGLNTALMLSGSRMAVFKQNAAIIQAAADKGGNSVDNWATIQGTFNFKLEQAKTAVQNTGIAVGTALLPAVTKLLQGITSIVIPIAEWTARNKGLTETLFIGITAIAGTIAILAGARKAYKAVTGAIDDVKNAVGLAQTALRKLGLISQQTAGQEAAAAKSAAASQETAATEAAASQEAKAAETAAAEETAAVKSSSSWIASAARTVAAWAAAGVRMIAQAAVWVAGNTAKVAVVVAENIAGAATSAAAWIAANAAMLAGIGLIVVAVVAAVVLIVTHWKQVSAAVKQVWDDVYGFIHKVISDVIGFVKSHWPLLIGIIGGPMALAVAEIIKHWNDIRRIISTAISDVKRIISDAMRVVELIWDTAWRAVRDIVFGRWGDLMSLVRSFPGKIYSALSTLYGDMLSIGKNIVIGIWNGLASMASWLWNMVTGWAGSLVNGIKHAFGIGSPSKYTTEHGKMLGEGVAVGMLASIPRVLGAARQMAAGVLAVTSGLNGGGHTAGLGAGLSVAGSLTGAGAGGGGTTINLYVTGNTVMSDKDISLLVDKIGKKLATVVLPAAGRATRTF